MHDNDKNTSKQKVETKFNTKQEQKQRRKNKIGLPPNKRYRLTQLARHKSKDRSRYCHNSGMASHEFFFSYYLCSAASFLCGRQK